ncbi:hypothetical protein Acr_23g0009440 [Actinidia rufa]|uniref:NB-ARC domain-containing protein n=1 Tax=Actinidia rufa TaxID=165716 RepID=A0A7J0GP38_9ERIC|nr:hypothetical protein Acr_23g0009440 [Actinidia rufa]
MAETLGNAVLEQNVYWVTVSKEFSIHRLQNDIAKAVGGEISHEGDEMRRAALLFKVLMKRKNSVLILDDMWDHFLLEKVGVPIGWTGCKLILTSRSLDQSSRNYGYWTLVILKSKELLKVWKVCLQKLILDYSSEHVRVQAEELMSLRHLEEFEGQLYDLHGFNRYVKSQHYKGLKVYRLQVRSGECQNRSAYIDFEDKYDKEVRIVNCSLVRKRGGRDPLLLPHDIQYLEIDECQIVAGCLLDVSSSLRNARELKACAIVHCDGIEYILPSSSSLSPSSNAPFQSLEKLDLHGLQNLSDLYKWGRGGATPTNGTFLNLKHLDISGCPSIRKLFTIHLLQNLHNLELIYVWECKQMEEIIALDNEEENETESMDESTTTTTSSSNQSSSSHWYCCFVPKAEALVIAAVAGVEEHLWRGNGL